MGKRKPLKRRCANNWCTTNAALGEILCRIHLRKTEAAIKRKELLNGVRRQNLSVG